jgi:hypothetical protein
MIKRLSSLSLLSIMAASMVALTGAGIRPIQAAPENTFQVQLIWGTDGERPKDKPLKDVEPKLLEKLKGVFKWKNYYEVEQKSLTVPKQGSQKLKMSEKCEIELQDLSASRIEIRLFGEGKLVVKKAQTVVPDEPIVLGGGGKDQTAWFVVLTPAKP